MIDPDFGVVTDFQEWLNRVLEQEPAPKVRLSIDGKEFILQNVTTEISAGESEDIDVVSLSFDVPSNPLERFSFKVGEPIETKEEPCS